MTEYQILSENTESTVVMEYTPAERAATSYESEAALEEAFIRQLVAQKYERLTITSEADLIANLRHQLEKLNDTTFTDSEWQRFFKDVIAKPNNGIAEKTAMIQEDHIQLSPVMTASRRTSTWSRKRVSKSMTTTFRCSTSMRRRTGTTRTAMT